MLLTNPEYFAFLALVFFAWWPLVRRRLSALTLIAFANLFFYARWSLWYLALVPAASFVDFSIGIALERQASGIGRRMLVSASLALNIGLMASLKLLPLAHPAWSWTLPLALSFYAFQSLTYTIDIYRGDAKPTGSYLAYLCSSCFFPTTLAGPITRISTLLKQFDKLPKTLAPEDGGRALFLIGLGLLKKFLIADYLAEQLINRVFDAPRLYSSAEVLIAVYGYALQIYYDFSGYTDIARGSALLLGIRLPVNFNRPYAALNIADFWRRWHITLSNWLRDYLYFSLPGLRSRWKAWAYLNLIVTMTLGGLWHGASLTFIIWGLLHGIGLAAFRLHQSWRGNRKPSTAFTARLVRGLVTFHFVTFAWIFFRAPGVSTARDLLSQIAAFTFSLANVTPGFVLVAALAAAVHFVPERWYQTSLRVFSAAPAPVQAAVLATLVLAIQQLANTGAAPFVYARF